jgi:putative oxidoreductase
MSSQSGPGQDRLMVDISLVVVRVVAGIVFAAHGAQKMFGWFGGGGLQPLVDSLGPIGYLVAIGEFFGGLGLIVGFLTRFSAASNIVIMLGAIAMVHGKNGFFLSNSGFEYNLTLIALMLPTVLAGPGRWAVGHYLPLPGTKTTGRPVVFLE